MMLKKLTLLCLIFVAISSLNESFSQFIERETKDNEELFPFSTKRGSTKRIVAINDSISYDTKKQLWNSSVNKKRYTDFVADYLGPANTNSLCGAGRVNNICVDPQNENHIWLGTASGGLWESVNGGLEWIPKTDFLPSIGVTQIDYHTNNPAIIYLATGDGNGLDVLSFGLLKSLDGGMSWDTTALTFSLQPGEIIRAFSVNEVNGDNLLVLSNRALYKTSDGGQTFSVILYGDFPSIVRDPANSDIVYISQYDEYSRVLKSVDDGLNWGYIDNNLPTNNFRYELSTTPELPGEVFAAGIINGTDSLRIFRSTDGGLNWTTSEKHNIAYQSGFNLYFEVSKTLPIRYYFGAVWSWKSTDFGQTFNSMSEWQPVHCDHHDILQTSSGTLYDCSDGGVWKSVDDGANWINLNNNLGAIQFYRFDVCESDTSAIGAGAQDNCYLFKNSNTSYDWRTDVGGDIMEVLIDPFNPSIQYVNGIGGAIIKTINGGINWTNPNTTVELPEGMGDWITPFCMNQQNPQTLYAGFTDVWKSTNGGVNWVSISSNLNAGNNLACLTIAESDSSVIYAADRNNFYATFDEGNNWVDQTSNIPFSGIIERIKVNKFNPLEVWVVCNSFQDDKKVYKSTDGGFNWSNLTMNLPNIPFSCIEFINDSLNTCFLGSQFGLYFKNDTIADWTKVDNIPNTLVSDLRFNGNTKTLFCSTFGRGLWKLYLDDVLLLLNTKQDEDQSDLLIYPNPTKDIINIKSTRNDTPYLVRISDSRGVDLVTINEFNDQIISLEGFPGGMYFLRIYYSDSLFSFKILKK